MQCTTHAFLLQSYPTSLGTLPKVAWLNLRTLLLLFQRCGEQTNNTYILHRDLLSLITIILFLFNVQLKNKKTTNQRCFIHEEIHLPRSLIPRQRPRKTGCMLVCTYNLDLPQAKAWFSHKAIHHHSKTTTTPLVVVIQPSATNGDCYSFRFAEGPVTSGPARPARNPPGSSGASKYSEADGVNILWAVF